jgi:hypothetical protein
MPSLFANMLDANDRCEGLAEKIEAFEAIDVFLSDIVGESCLVTDGDAAELEGVAARNCLDGVAENRL